MAEKSSSRKKPVSQKRVALVLASLVGTMTLSAAALLLMEGGAMGTSIPGMAADAPGWVSYLNASPLQASRWNYIMIYESADVTASAATLAGGFSGGSLSPVRPKANFHFVIDSASSGMDTMEGRLEVGTSWQKQDDGAYAGWPRSRSHPFSPYKDAVGICLAADINRKAPSETQQQVLLSLVRQLQNRLGIPRERVLFHWDPQVDASLATPARQAFAQNFRSQMR